MEDAMIFSEGRPAPYIYVLKEGKISLQKSLRTPNVTYPRRTAVAFCYPEEILGWSALVDPYKYTLSAVAWESSRLIKIDANQLREVLDSHPEMGYRITTALSSIISRRLRQTTDSLINEREYAYYGAKV
jgi:CRP-like cAMP-binding protein